MPEVRFEETERGPALDNGDLRIEVHLNKGTFNVIDLRARRAVLRDAAIAISLRDAPAFQTRGEGFEFAGPTDVDDVHGRGVSLTLVRETDEGEPEISFTVTLYEDSRSAIVQAEVHNTTPSPVTVQTFHVLHAATLNLDAPGKALRFYKHGWQSWSPSLVVHVTDEPTEPVVEGTLMITVAETVGIDTRGKYYEEAGIIRDMFQNHLLQLLALAAMEPPIVFNGNEVRNEKVKVLHAVRPLVGQGDVPVVLGQYVAGEMHGEHMQGYREEKDVDSKSITPTFAAIRFSIDNWRWKHVPFYVRSGKRLAERRSEIAITFRSPPVLMFGQEDLESGCPSTLILRMQPDEGIALRFQVKTPGAQNELTSNMEISPVDMEFSYAEAFGSETPPAYQTLLLDIMIGDQTLFTRSDEVEAAWSIIDPLLRYFERRPPRDLPAYPAGSWGPAQGDELMRGAHSRWR